MFVSRKGFVIVFECLTYFLGEDACLPTECAAVTVVDDTCSINEGFCSAASPRPAEATVANKKPLKRVSSGDVLQLQYECLSCQKGNLLLKKRKLELQIQLLEQQVNASLTRALNGSCEGFE